MLSVSKLHMHVLYCMNPFPHHVVILEAFFVPKSVRYDVEVQDHKKNHGHHQNNAKCSSRMQSHSEHSPLVQRMTDAGTAQLCRHMSLAIMESCTEVKSLNYYLNRTCYTTFSVLPRQS